MTHDKPMEEQQGGAPAQPEELTCEAAQELLPAFIDAEQAGDDVDNMPQFAALLHHLDTCADCLELYEVLSEDQAVLTEPAAQPGLSRTPPIFFPQEPEAMHPVLRLLEGLKRSFELILPRPQLAWAGGVLSGRRERLFAEQVTDLKGEPTIAVVLEPSDTAARVLVSIRETFERTPWNVQLTIAGRTRETRTDAQGLAVFEDVTVEELQQASQLVLLCAAEDVSGK